MGCPERDLSLFNLPIKEKQWTLAAKKSGKWFIRVEEAAEQYMERWFVKGKGNVAKRTLEVQNTQHLALDTVGLKTRGGRKRSRVKGGAGTTARPVEKLKAHAETWHWPSVQLRCPVTTVYCCGTIPGFCVSVLFAVVPCSLPSRWYPPTRTLPFCVGCVTLLLFYCVTHSFCSFFPIFFFSLASPFPWSVFLCPPCVDCVVLDPPA